MLCKNPYMQGNHAYGCTQCMPCRLNRRRVWTHRMMLEALVHSAASFVTLTYSDEWVPENGSLQPRDLQLFLKRLRRSTSLPIRFFACGEYGDLTWRPHYHLALYGIDETYKDVVEKNWGLGLIHIGTLTTESAQYVAGYVTKKLTKKSDPILAGRHPEFARMSLRPGIGALSIQSVADALSCRNGWDEIERLGDVPAVLRHGPGNYPLGSYLRRRLREAMNFDDLKQSKEASLLQSQEMLAMWEDYICAAKSPKETLKGMLLDLNKQKTRNLETRMRIHSKKGSI